MKIQQIFEVDPPELYIQTIKVKNYDGTEIEIVHLPIERARLMLNDKLDSWGTKNFQVSRPYLYDGVVLVDSSCELYGEVQGMQFNFVGASTFSPKDFKGNRSIAQIGLAESIKNGIKNLGRYFGRDFNKNQPDVEMMTEIINQPAKKKQPSVTKAVNDLVKSQGQK